VPGLNLLNLNQPTSLSATAKDLNPFELENMALKERISGLKDKMRRHKESYTFAFNDMHAHISQLALVRIYLNQLFVGKSET
jgi:hypothetical protein